jgi:hypothetical protein
MKSVDGVLGNQVAIAGLAGAAMTIPFFGWFPIIVVGATLGGMIVLLESAKAAERDRRRRR